MNKYYFKKELKSQWISLVFSKTNKRKIKEIAGIFDYESKYFGKVLSATAECSETIAHILSHFVDAEVKDYFSIKDN